MEVKQTTYGSDHNASATKSPLVRIAGVFKEEKGKGFEVRVTAEILAALQGVSEGDYLKVYENVAKTSGINYLSLNVKPMGQSKQG